MPHARIVAALSLACAAHAAVAQTLTPLGPLSGANYSYAFGLSGDGGVAVGFSDRAFRWTPAGGAEDLGVQPGGSTSQAQAVSDDGAVVAGFGNSSGPFYTGFRWTRSTGMVSLGTLGATSQALAISADGAAIVGTSVLVPSAARHTFRWRADTGMQDLGSLGGSSTPTGVSADGSVVVGSSTNEFSSTRAFRWTAATGMVSLGVMPGDFISNATAVSRDGSTIYGWSSGSNGATTFRWTVEQGMTPVPALTEPANSLTINALSGDGSVLAGRYSGGAFLWSAATGLVDIRSYLAAHGVNVAGWQLTAATGISRDGRTVVGNGIFASTNRAWIVTLPGCATADFNHDGDVGTDSDIEAFFRCLAGTCCPACGTADFNGDGDVGTDQDIEAFFRVLAGSPC